MTVEAVIFDIGNVLVEWRPEAYFDRVYGIERRTAMFAMADLHGMNDLLDAGAAWQDTVYDWAERHPDWRTEIRDWHDNWIKLASPLIPHSLRLMRALKARGVPVFALTNFGAQSFAYARGEYVFLSEFDRAYVSGQMKVTKPDPVIYQMVEDDCGIPPERLFFTDDRRENIAAAETRGWQTHLFEHPQGLADRLVDLRLLTPDEAR